VGQDSVGRGVGVGGAGGVEKRGVLGFERWVLPFALGFEEEGEGITTSAVSVCVLNISNEKPVRHEQTKSTLYLFVTRQAWRG